LNCRAQGKAVEIRGEIVRRAKCWNRITEIQSIITPNKAASSRRTAMNLYLLCVPTVRFHICRLIPMKPVTGKAIDLNGVDTCRCYAVITHWIYVEMRKATLAATKSRTGRKNTTQVTCSSNGVLLSSTRFTRTVRPSSLPCLLEPRRRPLPSPPRRDGVECDGLWPASFV
jgi:hypothetical protein